MALLTLLYGTGLRISEALSLKRRDAPLGETLTIVGKGRKERGVPVLAAVREAVDDYVKVCPFAPAKRHRGQGCLHGGHSKWSTSRAAKISSSRC